MVRLFVMSVADVIQSIYEYYNFLNEGSIDYFIIRGLFGSTKLSSYVWSSCLYVEFMSLEFIYLYFGVLSSNVLVGCVRC